MIVTDILQFLGELQENNTYEWMQAHKSWYIQYAFSPAELADDRTFCAAVWEKCRLMQPFNNYLNTALAGFEMPKR